MGKLVRYAVIKDVTENSVREDTGAYEGGSKRRLDKFLQLGVS
jgi:hypothetical protein